jgi:transcriptional regulator with XRE-family HTH domain
LSEFATAREAAGLSHEQLAGALGASPTSVRRLLTGRLNDPGVIAISEMASVLGFEMSLGLHPIGDPLRDKGQLAVGRRFEAMLAEVWSVTNETLLPGTGELRAWDKLLRLVGASPRHLVGADVETRVRDIQALTRRTRARERDGHVDAILIVLADTATNRRLAPQLRDSLGEGYATSPRTIMKALRLGERLPGSGVILV